MNLKKPRRVIIFAIIIVVVAAAATAAAIWMSRQNGGSDSGEDQAGDGGSSVPAELPAERKADEADKLALDGDVQGGAKQLDEAIENTSDSFEKFIYYSRKATLLYNNNDFAGAQDAAIKAYAIQKTSDSAAFVGQIAKERGDKALALDYYKRAVAAIDNADPFADEDRAYYQGIISELERGL